MVRKHYKVLFEVHADRLWIHSSFTKWNKTIKQEAQKDFDTLMSLVNLPVFALHDPEDFKHKKFLNLFGFVFYKEIMGKDDKPRQIFVRSK